MAFRGPMSNVCGNGYHGHALSSRWPSRPIMFSSHSVDWLRAVFRLFPFLVSFGFSAFSLDPFFAA